MTGCLLLPRSPTELECIPYCMDLPTPSRLLCLWPAISCLQHALLQGVVLVQFHEQRSVSFLLRLVVCQLAVGAVLNTLQ